MPTSTPAVYRQASFTVRQAFMADLDQGAELSTASGADFLYETVSENERYLKPMTGARFLQTGSLPGYADCRDSALSDSKIDLGTFPIGGWMCYKTAQGRFGRLRLVSYGDPDGSTMYIETVTWKGP